jgi:hypothetical protein
MINLISVRDLPNAFSYPASFVRIVELGIINLEPWVMLDGEMLYSRFKGLADRYPGRALIPFARRQDNDDVACWDAHRGREVLIIHDYADPGYELRGIFPSFYAWLREAVNDMIEFEPEE